MSRLLDLELNPVKRIVSQKKGTAKLFLVKTVTRETALTISDSELKSLKNGC